MIVTFELNGHECIADVRAVGTLDECPYPMPDVTYDIRWIQDSGAPQRELDNAAVAAFQEAEERAARRENACCTYGATKGKTKAAPCWACACEATNRDLPQDQRRD